MEMTAPIVPPEPETVEIEDATTEAEASPVLMLCGMESVRASCIEGTCGVQLGTHPGMEVF